MNIKTRRTDFQERSWHLILKRVTCFMTRNKVRLRSEDLLQLIMNKLQQSQKRTVSSIHNQTARRAVTTGKSTTEQTR